MQECPLDRRANSHFVVADDAFRRRVCLGGQRVEQWVDVVARLDDALGAPFEERWLRQLEGDRVFRQDVRDPVLPVVPIAEAKWVERSSGAIFFFNDTATTEKIAIDPGDAATHR